MVFGNLTLVQNITQLLLPDEDNVLNKLRILKEMHVQMRKPYHVIWSDKKTHPSKEAPVGD